MTIKPIGERVLVKPVKKSEKTASGIILSGTSEKDNPNLGEVIALGKGEKLADIKVGDTVVYAKFAGTEIESIEKYIILNAEDVLAVMEV